MVDEILHVIRDLRESTARPRLEYPASLESLALQRGRVVSLELSPLRFGQPELPANLQIEALVSEVAADHPAAAVAYNDALRRLELTPAFGR